ncbi:glucokinase [Luteimonas panaciterrae]|uniref:glucokinase n=1 Tax=Luteimonas panaciterrae TaxID=363885 RepID=UPI001CF9D43C|nr:glucokinase [Luteimonas panaciterrae]
MSAGTSGSGRRTLLADIGGTNARFALADPDAPLPLLTDTVQKYAVTDFPSLGDAAQHYLEQTGVASQADVEVKQGVFAIAGRVEGDVGRITNHPWVISKSRTCETLHFDHLELVNDFAAQSMSIVLLQTDDVVPVGGVAWRPDSEPRDRVYAVIGPGTGLGVGVLVVRGGEHWPIETEGGHVSFPPGTPEEIAILERLSAQFGRVSNERLICGPGLVNIHRALSEIARTDPGPMTPEDITARAAQGDLLCMRSIDVFCAVFGAIAGDLVLTTGAWDGVFLTGGLVPRMLDALRRSGFRQRFEHKGRFSSNMARIPSLAVLHPHAGLLGTAAIARRIAAKPQ